MIGVPSLFKLNVRIVGIKILSTLKTVFNMNRESESEREDLQINEGRCDERLKANA